MAARPRPGHGQRAGRHGAGRRESPRAATMVTARTVLLLALLLSCTLCCATGEATAAGWGPHGDVPVGRRRRTPLWGAGMVLLRGGASPGQGGGGWDGEGAGWPQMLLDLGGPRQPSPRSQLDEQEAGGWWGDTCSWVEPPETPRKVHPSLGKPQTPSSGRAPCPPRAHRRLPQGGLWVTGLPAPPSPPPPASPRPVPAATPGDRALPWGAAWGSC